MMAPVGLGAVGQRQQQRDRGRRADARQHADDLAEQHAGEAHQQIASASAAVANPCIRSSKRPHRSESPAARPATALPARSGRSGTGPRSSPPAPATERSDRQALDHREHEQQHQEHGGPKPASAPCRRRRRQDGQHDAAACRSAPPAARLSSREEQLDQDRRQSARRAAMPYTERQEAGLRREALPQRHARAQPTIQSRPSATKKSGEHELAVSRRALHRCQPTCRAGRGRASPDRRGTSRRPAPAIGASEATLSLR